MYLLLWLDQFFFKWKKKKKRRKYIIFKLKWKTVRLISVDLIDLHLYRRWNDIFFTILLIVCLLQYSQLTAVSVTLVNECMLFNNRWGIKRYIVNIRSRAATVYLHASYVHILTCTKYSFFFFFAFIMILFWVFFFFFSSYFNRFGQVKIVYCVF